MRTEKSRSAYLKAKIVRFPEGLDGSTEQIHTGILRDSDKDVKTFCLCGLASRPRCRLSLFRPPLALCLQPLRDADDDRQVPSDILLSFGVPLGRLARPDLFNLYWFVIVVLCIHRQSVRHLLRSDKAVRTAAVVHRAA